MSRIIDELKRRPILGLALALVVIILSGYWFFIRNERPELPKIDDRLVGTWLSKDTHGYRLILLWSGDFVVTLYGQPQYGPETWEAARGQLHLELMGDHGEIAPATVSYTLSPDGQHLSLSEDVFGINAKEFVRAMTKP
jgi:hypothetical protein